MHPKSALFCHFGARHNRAVCASSTSLILSLLLVFWSGLDLAQATPHMSLLSGTPCAGCHSSPHGGGGRTELGWSSMNHVGAFTYDQVGLGVLHKQKSNMIGGKVSVGFDMRLQGVRLGRPQVDPTSSNPSAVIVPDFMFIPMQVQPYLAIKPTYDLTIYASFLPGSDMKNITQHVYPGMSSYEAWALYQVHPTLMVRAGAFQPTFGIRHDDHTILLRGDARRRNPIIPPNFTELGAEVRYQPRRWLRAEVGGFGSQN